jgi:hypothetical protein
VQVSYSNGAAAGAFLVEHVALVILQIIIVEALRINGKLIIAGTARNGNHIVAVAVGHVIGHAIIALSAVYLNNIITTTSMYFHIVISRPAILLNIGCSSIRAIIYTHIIIALPAHLDKGMVSGTPAHRTLERSRWKCA